MSSHMVTARKRSSLVSTLTYLSLSSSRLSLLLALFLATYPQSAAAAPGNDRVRRSRKSRTNAAKLLVQPEVDSPIMQRRSILRRLFRGELNPRDFFDWGAFFSSFVPPDSSAQSQSPGNSNGNGNQNDSNAHHSSSQARPTSTAPTQKSSTTTPKATTTTKAQATTQQETTSSPPPSSENSESESQTTGSNSNISGSTTHTGNSPSGVAPGGNPQQSNPATTPQPQPWDNGPYNDPGGQASVAPSGASDPSNQSGVNRALVAGLVVSLVILLGFCAFAAFLVMRRMRKKRREREEISSFNDTAPWIRREKGEVVEEFDISEKADTREGSPDSSLARIQSISSEPRMRARTPGGSSAVPVPYDPSEVSDDVSAHFTFFPQDDAIGVPVPYPLALHIPARVAKVMAERDARWEEYEHQRRQRPHHHSLSNASGQTYDDLLTIPDQPSRPDYSRRSTQRSMTDSMLSSNDPYAGAHFAPGSRLSRAEYGTHVDSRSDVAYSRSDAGMNGHPSVDERSVAGSDIGESVMSPVTITDFPIPPPPASTRPQSWRLRRVSAAPSIGTSYSPRLRSVSENPFATEADLNLAENVAAFDHSSDEGTATQHGGNDQLTAGAATTERVQMHASPARIAYIRNPFEDVVAPEDITEPRHSRLSTDAELSSVRSSVRDSDVFAGVVEVDHQTVDGHDSTIFAFPAPPKPTRRPS